MTGHAGQWSAASRWSILFWLGGLLLVVMLLWLFSGILAPFAAGFAIAYFLDPVCDKLENYGLPRGLAALIVLIGFIFALIAVLLIFIPLVEGQIIDLVGRLPRFVEAGRHQLNMLLGFLQERLPPEEFGKLRDAVGDRLGAAMSWVGGVLEGLLTRGIAFINILSLVFITPIVGFFLLRDWDRMVARVDSWLPRAQLETIREQARQIDQALAGFIRGQALVCLTMGTFYAIALSLAGLDFGLVLGFLVGLLIFIPFLGGTIGAALAVLLALTQFDSFGRVAIIGGIFLVGQTVEGNFLTPKLVGERINLHPVWVIFALLAFGDLFGFGGLLIAVPVAAVLGVLIRFSLQRYLASPLYDPDLSASPQAPPPSETPARETPPREAPARLSDASTRL